jgi:hypothetical protein
MFVRLMIADMRQPAKHLFVQLRSYDAVPRTVCVLNQCLPCARAGLCRKFTMSCGYGHYKNLMAQFNVVVEVFLTLDEQYQDVIADITRRMGAGMADFIQREVRVWECRSN